MHGPSFVMREASSFRPRPASSASARRRERRSAARCGSELRSAADRCARIFLGVRCRAATSADDTTRRVRDRQKAEVEPDGATESRTIPQRVPRQLEGWPPIVAPARVSGRGGHDDADQQRRPANEYTCVPRRARRARAPAAAEGNAADVAHGLWYICSAESSQCRRGKDWFWLFVGP